jgi:hypothetical protein
VIGGPALFVDPEMAGTWAAPDVSFVIGHSSLGLVHAVAFSEQEGSPWGSMVASGRVTAARTASASGELWRMTPDGQQQLVGSVLAALERSGNMLTAALVYVDEGALRVEEIGLTRQTE